MGEFLLQTKLYIPISRPGLATRASLVPRPHLVERLDEGPPGKLTLICAPAGFGKTTLVNSWLAHFNLPAAWLPANRIRRFIVQELVMAVSTVKKHIDGIYSKLDVGSHTHAVAKAREIGLL